MRRLDGRREAAERAVRFALSRRNWKLKVTRNIVIAQQPHGVAYFWLNIVCAEYVFGATKGGTLMRVVPFLR